MKLILIGVLLLFQMHVSYGQNLYLTASSGYNLGTNKSNFENYTYNKWIAVVYPYDKDRVAYSLGKGVDFNIGIGYTTRYKIGFELAGSYLYGLKTMGSSQYIEDDIFKKEIYSRFYRISPSVHFIHELKRISLKMSLGGIVGFGKMYLNQEAIYKDEPWVQYENEFSGGIYFGLKAGIGVSYRIGKRLSLFADLNWVNAYYSPSKAQVTKFMSEGKDYTDILEPIERETEYVNSVEAPPYDTKMPYKKLHERFAASSIGLQVGIQWILWSKLSDKKEAE